MALGLLLEGDEAKVSDLGHALGAAEQHVLRLEVAMDDGRFARVQEGEAEGDVVTPAETIRGSVELSEVALGVHEGLERAVGRVLLHDPDLVNAVCILVQGAANVPNHMRVLERLEHDELARKVGQLAVADAQSLRIRGRGHGHALRGRQWHLDLELLESHKAAGLVHELFGIRPKAGDVLALPHDAKGTLAQHLDLLELALVDDRVRVQVLLAEVLEVGLGACVDVAHNPP
mmetsp:Transcript_21525/g.57887  ORF Transcript_21525/g.57887 Transcript_21525/m.57887 type:complete len:232 (+) Transcript_21525:1126-1821(+)